MIDHTGITVSYYERSKPSYSGALAPLGYELTVEIRAEQNGATVHAGFGHTGKTSLRATTLDTYPGEGVHVALVAGSRTAGDAFHAAALSAGGIDHAAPGLRPRYHPDYYGVFVRDRDGHNIEAICRLADA